MKINIVNRSKHKLTEDLTEKSAGMDIRANLENEIILKQKLELGLFNQDQKRLAALKTLKISNDIKKYHFILILVDYNPFSTHLTINNLKALPFANQVKIFYGGFALWKKNLIDV